MVVNASISNSLITAELRTQCAKWSKINQNASSRKRLVHRSRRWQKKRWRKSSLLDSSKEWQDLNHTVLFYWKSSDGDDVKGFHGHHVWQQSWTLDTAILVHGYFHSTCTGLSRLYATGYNVYLQKHKNQVKTTEKMEWMTDTIWI